MVTASSRHLAGAVPLVLLAASLACGKKDAADATPAAPSASAPAPVASASAPPVRSAPPTPPPPPAANPADVSAVKACCAAIHAEAAKPGPKKAELDTLAKSCDGIAAVVARGQSSRTSAIASIRASGARAGALPSACQ